MRQIDFQKLIMTAFFMLLVLDVSRVFMAKQQPPQQEAAEQAAQQNQQRQSESDSDMNNQQQDQQQNNDVFDEDDAESFKDFKTNDYKEQRRRKAQNKRSKQAFVKINFCASSKFKSQETQQQIIDSYADQNVEFDFVESLPNELFQMLAKGCSYIQFILIGFSIFGDKLFANNPPRWYVIMKEKKMIVLLVGMMIATMGPQYLMKTGDLDVYVDQDQVYTNAGKNGYPSVEHVISLIDNTLRESNN